MIERRAFLISTTTIPLAIVLAGCGSSDESSGMTARGYFFAAHRFRLTVEVETPEGMRRGSSVIQVRWSISSYEIDGEAVAVALPDGQTLFVLLRSEAQESADWAGFASTWVPQNIQDAWVLPRREKDASQIDKGKYFWEQVAEYRGTVPVPRTQKMPWGEIDNYPYFVRFKDIRDPSSVEMVDPDNLAGSFGPGYRLVSLTATFTADPVTHNIENMLTWLGSYPEPRLAKIPPGGAIDPTFAQKLAYGDFTRGIENK